MYMLVCSVQMIRRLDSQSKFQMFILSSGRHVGVLTLEVHQHGGFILHCGLCKFVQNISTNIWSLGKRASLKFGEVSSLCLSYNFSISWLYPLNGFRFIITLRNSASQEFHVITLSRKNRGLEAFWWRNHRRPKQSIKYVLMIYVRVSSETWLPRHCMEFKTTKDKIAQWNKMLLAKMSHF